MYIVNNSEATKQVDFIVGVGGVSNGDIVNMSAGKVVAGATADVDIVGIAQEDANADDVVSVELAEANTIQADYTGTFSATDIGTAFDLSDAQTVDQTATVNGDLILVGYNADTSKGLFLVPAGNRKL